MRFIKIITLWGFIINSIQILGQSISTYKGEFEGGRGEYSYFEDTDGERIKHGYFYFENKGYQGLGTYGQTIASIVSGNYIKGLHNGAWVEKYIEYRAGWTGALTHWDIKEKRNVVDGFLIENSNQINQESVVKCNYTNGILNGIYEMRTYIIDKGKSLLIKSVNANFINGILTGKFQYEDKLENIHGEFDSNGFMNGVWTYRNTSSVIKYFFKHGMLASLTERNKTDGTLIRKYDNIKVKYIDSLFAWGFRLDSFNNDNSVSDVNEFYTHEINSYSPLKENDLYVSISAINKTSFLKTAGSYKYKTPILKRKSSPIVIQSNDSYDSVLATSLMKGIWSMDFDSTTKIELRIDSLLYNGDDVEIAGYFKFRDKKYALINRVSIDQLLNKHIELNSYNNFDIDIEIENEVEFNINVFENFASVYFRSGKIEKEAILFK